MSWEVQDSQGADPEGTLDAINQYKRNLRKFDDDSYRVGEWGHVYDTTSFFILFASSMEEKVQIVDSRNT